MEIVEKKPSFLSRLRQWYKKERSPKETGWLTGISLVLCPIFLEFLCLFIGTSCSFYKFINYFRAPLILFLNLLPIAFAMWVIYLISNRVWIAWLATSIFFPLLSFINYFKLDLRGEALVFDDFRLVSEGAGMLGEYELHFPVIFFLTILIIVVGTWLLHHFARGKLPLKLIWVRLLGLAAVGAMGLFSWNQWYTDYVLYTNTRLQIQDVFSPWNDEGISAGGGLFWSLLRGLDEAYPSPPEGYSEANVQALLEPFPEEAIPEDKRVNVIATMLESFSDYSTATQLNFTQDPYAELHALQEESYSGSLISDSLGGGTVNAERSFLTGFTYRHPNYDRNTASFVRYFRDNGYSTQGGHPGYENFYSRKKINRLLGFETYTFSQGTKSPLVTEEDNYHGYESDHIFFTQRREAYENRDQSRPYFEFNVTFQGHSPYEEEIPFRQEYISHEGLDDEAYDVLNNYFSSVAETGRQISAFVDSFREDEEPVVLVFFGDHRPNLGADNCYLESLGVISQRRSAKDRQFLYTTPYLIWANDAAKKVLGKSFTGEGDTISPCYLMSEVFDCCGWTGPTWLQFQRSVRDDIPVMHLQNFILGYNGLTTAHSATAREAHNKYKIVEYYIRQQVPANYESSE